MYEATSTSAPQSGAVLLSQAEAAEVLGLSARTLERSRSTGQLLGYPSPPYRKFGARMVRYSREDLIAWMEAIPRQRNTAQG